MDFEKLKTSLRKHEGATDYMYADHKGNVTIGVGIMLESADAAEKILPLVFDTGSPGKSVTKEALRAAWTKVAEAGKTDFEHSKGNPKKAKRAKSYKDLTTIRLRAEAVDAQVTSRLFVYLNELSSHHVRDFWTLPERVQHAVVDMYFNLGYNKFGKYKELKRSMTARDWLKAALASQRKGVSAARNLETMNEFYTQHLQDKADAVTTELNEYARALERGEFPSLKTGSSPRLMNTSE